MGMSIDELNKSYEVEYFPTYFFDVWICGHKSEILKMWDECNIDAKKEIISYLDNGTSLGKDMFSYIALNK